MIQLASILSLVPTLCGWLLQELMKIAEEQRRSTTTLVAELQTLEVRACPVPDPDSSTITLTMFVCSHFWCLCSEVLNKLRGKISRRPDAQLFTPNRIDVTLPITRRSIN